MANKCKKYFLPIEKGSSEPTKIYGTSLLDKITLTETIKNLLLNTKGKFKLSTTLDKIYYPSENNPLFVFEKYRQLPINQDAVTLLMRNLGIKPLPYTPKLLVIPGKKNKYYPYLFSQVMQGKRVSSNGRRTTYFPNWI